MRLPKSGDANIVVSPTLSENQMKQILRDMNLKITIPRLSLLKILSSGLRHVTAQELYEKIQSQHPQIGFATVYRFLKSLTMAGMVTETRIGGMPARYEMMSKTHHDHLTCTECGKICEFTNSAIEKLQLSVAEKLGFILTSHLLELYGVCENCQLKSERKSNHRG